MPKAKTKESPSVQIGANILLAISFFEGAAVMAIELLGAKIIAPFYGTSLYVWASVLGVTLGALAFGYYSGGYISKKYQSCLPLVYILVVGAIFAIIMPRTAPFIMNSLSTLEVKTGSAISVLSFLFVPVACMGMASPIITQLISSDKNAGFSAGKVYSISTIGGILATFLTGFYLIPEFGIKATALWTGGILLLLAILILVLAKKRVPALGVGILLILFIFFSQETTKDDRDTIIRYQSSGILGEWTVIDQLAYVDNGDRLFTRHLLLNWVDQTYTQASNPPLSLWMYPHRLSALAGIKPKGSKALLLGMGGGSITYNLNLLGFEVDVIELDPRVPKIAEQWFNFNPDSATVIIDDARHYVRFTEREYDIVLLDMVNGEEPPAHVFTLEGLQELHQILTEDALVIVNFQGLIDNQQPKLSIAPRSVFKTFEEAGFNMQMSIQNPDGSKELSDDILMYGSPGDLDIAGALEKDIRYNRIFPFDQFTFKPSDFTPTDQVSVEDALVLTDDKMSLNMLNSPTVLSWRQKKIENTLDGVIQKGLSIYN